MKYLVALLDKRTPTYLEYQVEAVSGDQAIVDAKAYAREDFDLIDASVFEVLSVQELQEVT